VSRWEDDVRLEYVITLEQEPPAAEARAQAAQGRARAQDDAQRIRDIREDIREQVREQIRSEMQGPRGTMIHVPPPPPPWERNDIPPHVVDVITMFFVAMVICIVGFPIARAIGRWIDRRGLPSPVNAELAAQMNRIEQAVDTMSVEVERISEAQRYQAKLLTDREKVRA
jgi:hypothetical protein